MRRSFIFRRLGLAVSCLALLAANPIKGQGQTTDSVSAGALVRLRTSAQPAEWQVGTFLGRDADSIRVQIPTLSRSVSIPRHAITRLEISRGRRSNWRKGARIGGLVGAGTALLFIPAAADACENTCVLRTPAAIAVLAGVLGGVGAGVGALVGSASVSEHWEPVSPWQLSVLVLPDALTVRISLFRN